MSHVASWMSFKDVISVASERIKDRGMQGVAWPVLSEYADEANREFVRRSEVVKGSTQFPLIPEQRLYRLPNDCVKVDDISVKYPGDTDYWKMNYVNQKKLTEYYIRGQTGKPSEWYITNDRKSFGLYPIPILGGFDGLTTAGNTTTMTLEATGASTEDDFYNDMTVTILSGSAQGQTTTVADYVGSTLVITFDDTLTSVGTARVQIGREMVNLDYTASGNGYSIQAVTSAVATSVGTPRYNSIPITAGSYTPDYFKGCEIRFTNTTTTTILQGNKTRCLSSYGSVLTVFPELLTAPVNADAIEINSIPNIPDEYHHFLSDYIVYRAMERLDRGLSSSAMMMFEKGVEESKRLLQPIQGDEYETVRGGYWDD